MTQLNAALKRAPVQLNLQPTYHQDALLERGDLVEVALEQDHLASGSAVRTGNGGGLAASG